MSAFDQSLACDLARASRVAYDPGDTTPAPGLVVDEEFNSAEESVAGFVGHNGADVILAFRGTVAPDDDFVISILNWLRNLDSDQTPRFQGDVHQGFSNGVDQVRGRFMDIIQRRRKPTQRLWVTGHSLGGALATLAAALLAEQPKQDVFGVTAVYTFGSPRVGNSAFARQYQPLLFRCERGDDIVPHVPPRLEIARLLNTLLPGKEFDIRDFVHAGALKYIDRGGRLRDDAPGLDDDRLEHLAKPATFLRSGHVEDHRIDGYVAALGGS